MGRSSHLQAAMKPHFEPGHGWQTSSSRRALPYPKRAFEICARNCRVKLYLPHHRERIRFEARMAARRPVACDLDPDRDFRSQYFVTGGIEEALRLANQQRATRLSRSEKVLPLRGSVCEPDSSIPCGWRLHSFYSVKRSFVDRSQPACAWILCDRARGRTAQRQPALNANRQNVLPSNCPGKYPPFKLSGLSSLSFPHVQYMPT